MYTDPKEIYRRMAPEQQRIVDRHMKEAINLTPRERRQQTIFVINDVIGVYAG